jgi:hypothetical protein
VRSSSRSWYEVKPVVDALDDARDSDDADDVEAVLFERSIQVSKTGADSQMRTEGEGSRELTFPFFWIHI